MSSVPYRVAGLVYLFCAFIGAAAQQTSRPNVPDSPAPVPLEQVPRVPGLTSFWRGFNAGVTFSGVHDSSISWYTVATPAVSYSFSPHYSVDATATIYPSRLVPVESADRRSEHLEMDTGDVGDTAISLHAGFNPHGFHNVTTAAFTIPTGNKQEGLGAGEATYDFSNRFEGYHKQAGFLIDFGAGNSSGLFNRLLTNDYTSVGGLIHVQAGGSFWLFGSNSIQSVFYEQYPVGSQTVYAQPHMPGSGQGATYVLRGSEDNGVTTSIGIPLSDHLILSGYYSRSFQFDLDTVSVGMTYVLRSIHRTRHLSLVDRALREAESSVDDPAEQPSTTPRIF